ncbi:hypothetical protein LguiA_003520 [Lonicera macranthoides]
MPLYRRKAFPLLERPNDLKPEELVFQVRFTKEIFRDYGEYLNRINLYRQRVWTCKVTGKSNLTYEEALVSEKRATEKVQQFPEELVEHVLRDVQFSMLTLKDLVNTIAAKLQEHVLEGSELYGRKNNRIYPCKVVKVLKDSDKKTQYQVAWLDKDKKITSNAVVVGEDLIRKKLPFTREVLKSFIRESTYRSVPWVLHDKLALMHGIATDPPEELKGKVFLQDGLLVNNKKRKKSGKENDEEFGKCKRKKPGGQERSETNAEEDDDGKPKEEAIKYPIDDLMVHSGADDPVFTQRPSLCRDFNVPMDCVGELIMVWDFCSSFSRLLNLWPFSLEDFENALCHKESNVVLIVECHSALLRLLIKDSGDYFTTIQKKKRKPKITLVTWTEFLCDFIEMMSIAELSKSMSTIRRGHYGLLNIHAKLRILQELVAKVLETDVVREKLDEYIEERQELAATRRAVAIEEGRKRREDKERSKVDADSNGKEMMINGTVDRISSEPENHTHNRQNGHVAGKHKLEYSASNQVNGTSKTNVKKQKVGAKITSESNEDSSRKGAHILMNEGKKEMLEKKSKEQGKEYLEREMEKRFIRTNPLGKDRYYNRYWFFRRDARIFVESSDSAQWGYYNTKEELDALMGSLNRKGERERALQKQLQKCYDTICSKLEKRSKEVAQRTAMEEAELRRSSRVRAPPRDNPSLAFRKYNNKWKED